VKGFEKRQEGLNEEIDAHLQMALADRIERGESEEEARASVLKDFGNVNLIKDVAWQMGGNVWVGRIYKDVRYSIRQLRRNPLFSFLVISMLALGIAAPTTMFTVVKQVLLRDLPYGEPAGIVEIRETEGDGQLSGLRYSILENLNGRLHALAQLGFSTNTRHTLFLQAHGQTVQISAPLVSANLFSVLKVKPALGQKFDTNDIVGKEKPTNSRELILSNTVWRDVYRGDTKIVGKTVTMNGTPYVVTGVMPEGFYFPLESNQTQVWVCACGAIQDMTPQSQTNQSFRGFARLNDRQSVSQTQALLNSALEEGGRLHLSSQNIPMAPLEIARYRESVVDGQIRKGLIALLIASGALWLITCVNATSLMFARASTRQKEFMIRQAVGGSHWRIARQLFIEGAIISIVASAIGYVLSVAVISLFEQALKTSFHIGISSSASGDVFLALFGLAFLTAMLSSMGLSLNFKNTPIRLRARFSRSSSKRPYHRYRRRLLVIVEIAMTLTLLVACGLLLRTVYALRHAPLGFRADHVLVVNMKIPAYKFKGNGLSAQLYEPLIRRLQKMPGVEAATILTDVPLGNSYEISLTFENQLKKREEDKQNLQVHLRAVGPEMQRVFDIPMLSGRFFDENDTATSPFVVIVNRAFASEYLGPGQDPMKILGMDIFSDGPERKARVIGIFGDTRQTSATRTSEAEIEVCIPQITAKSRFYEAVDRLAMSVAIRTNLDSSSIMPKFKKEVESQDPQLGSINVISMEDIVEQSYGNRQIAAQLIGLFAIAALLLSAGGLYGLMAYLVTQRTKEIGIRIALGASSFKICWLIMREGTWMIVTGISLGLILVASLGWLLTDFLYGVSSHDLPTLTTAVVVMVICGLIASYLPAQRAAKLDAAKAIRAE
jgi:predicted permease